MRISNFGSDQFPVCRFSIVSVLLVIIFLSLFNSLSAEDCSSIKGTLTLISETFNKALVKKMYMELMVPIVIIDEQVYLPSSRCLESRNLGGNVEDRNLGGDSENRNLGGVSEKRNIGGDSEKRNLGGDTQSRSLNGDTEDRNPGGDSENRQLGGDTQARNLGGDTEERKLGGDSESRNIGGDAQARNLGGDSEDRSVGGDSMSFECMKNEDKTGFFLLNVNENSLIQVYNGFKFITVKNKIVYF